MGLAQQRRHQDAAALRHMTGGDLVGEDGLACARRALNDVGGTGYQAAHEQGIQPVDTCDQPLECFYHDSLAPLL